MSKPEVLVCRHVSKVYDEARNSLRIFDDISLTVEEGETLAIVGSSGSGKTTLLNILGGLDKPTGGDVIIDGQDLQRMSESARCRFRNQTLGFVYQFHHLLAEFTALENVAMPALLAGKSKREANALATEVLVRVGLKERLAHKPATLSGGERQRVAIARALVNRPRCVLLDEPTGNLDERTAGSVQELIMELREQSATSFVIVTHDMRLASRLQRGLRLEQGKLISLVAE